MAREPAAVLAHLEQQKMKLWSAERPRMPEDICVVDCEKAKHLEPGEELRLERNPQDWHRRCWKCCRQAQERPLRWRLGYAQGAVWVTDRQHP